MMKGILALGLILACFLNLEAQHSIKGRVLDEQGKGLSFTTVALLQPGDSVLMHFGVTNDQGAYQIKGIKTGSYIIQYSFVGKQTAYDQLEIPAPSNGDLGDKQLQAAVLKEVIVEAELIPVKFKKDTLEFDVKAFRTRPGAAAEEVLRQLPGVEVDSEGNIKAEGEDVVRVLVDGKEFFDDDPKVATKNLPAKALSKVQLIDRKSEEAVFSGVDDGIREKTINLQLKEDHKKGYFGEVAVGAGTEETYRLEAKVYHFTKKTQNALLGLYNNINEFGFSNKDNNQFGASNKGINEALAGGLNLSYNPTSQNRYFVSYLGNRREKDLEEVVSTENFLSDLTFQQTQDITQSDIDLPHKINYGLRHNFNDQQRLLIDGSFNLTQSDIFTQSFTNTSSENQLVNTLDNETLNDANAFNWSTKATYIAKFKEGKSQFKAEFRGNYNHNTNRLDWTNSSNFFSPSKEFIVDQFQTNEQDRLRLSIEPSLLQRLNSSWSLSLGTGFGILDEGLSRGEGILNTQNEFEELNIPDFNTRQRLLTPGFLLNRTGKKSQLNLRLAGVLNQFERLQNALSIRQDNYFFFTPNLSYQNEYKEGRRVNFGYVSEVGMPTVDQLLPVQNVIDPLNVIQGNPDLNPEQRHQVYSSWTIFDQFSFTAVSWRLSGTFTENKIRWAQTLDENLVKLTSPINVDKDINLNSYLDFSTPLRSLGLNLSITSNENWNQSIVFINGGENVNTNFTHALNVAFENRKNDVLAIRLSAAISLTDSRFSVAEDQNNIFFNTRYTGSLRYTPSNKWNFETTANLVNFNDRSFNESLSVPLLNAELSYFFLRAEKGSFTLSAFDLLNQYTGIQRIGNANFLRQARWNTLTQYFMLSFRLQFR